MSSKIKPFLLVLCWSAAVLPSLYGDPNGGWKKDIDALKVAMNCPEMAIQLWNGEIVVKRVARTPLIDPPEIGGFYSFTADTLEPKELVVPGLEQIVSVGEVSGTPFALGKAHNRLLLTKKEGGHWKEMPNLPLLQTSKDPRIIPSKTGLAIVSEDYLFRLNDGNWLPPVMLPPKVDLPIRYSRDRWNRKQVLYGSQLFVGWFHDKESDDGLLAMLDVSDPSAKWVQINGKKSATRQGIVGSGPVEDMAMDGENNLWISADHQIGEDGTMRRGIFHYNGSNWLTVLDREYEGDWTDFTQPRRARFGLGPDGKLYAVDSYCGILAFENGKFRRRIAIGLYPDIEKKITDERILFGSAIFHPGERGFAIDAAGNAFVATEGDFGILCFIKDKKGYNLKQVVLPGMTFYPQ